MASTSAESSTLAASAITPRLTLSLSGWRQLSARIADWPANAISITIRREEDGSGTPCVFHWSPPDLILRISLAPGEVTEAPVTELQDPASHGEVGVGAPVAVPGTHLIELWPGGETTLYGTIPDKYGPMLRVGGQYEVVWPGGEITQWALGTKIDHQGRHHLRPPGPNITMAAGPRFRLTAVTPQWWLQRQNKNKNRRRLPLFDPSARVPGAPILTVTLLADDATITGRNWDIGFSVKTKVTYKGVLGAEKAGPIIFHAGALTGYEAELLLERQNGETWEFVPAGFFCGGSMYLDDLPPGYRSARRESFVCLRPGESWMDTLDAMDGDPWDIPPDVAHGDVFRLCHRGCVVDWWGWGGPEGLTAVLDSFSVVGRNSVAYPTALDGRPRLVVPASDAIELEYQNRD